MKFNTKYILSSLMISAFLSLSGSDLNVFAVNESSIQIQFVTPAKLSGGEKSKAKFQIQRTDENKKTEFTFNLSTNNSSLIQFPKTEIKLLPSEERAEFEFDTLATAIKTSATIKVELSNSNEPSQVENTIEIVPALLKTVTTQPSMIGTRGAKVEVTVELKTLAPTGGIEIYVSPIIVSIVNEKITIPNPNLRVPAGNNKGSFFVEYDQILSNGSEVARIESPTLFNHQKRTIEFVVALEPQGAPGSRFNWQPIPGIATKTKFDVNPLLVSSISVQPSAITGGNEALGSFTLNFAPGNSESIFLKPSKIINAKLWITMLGSSCQESGGNSLTVEIPLTQGVTNYNFKVCTASVTAATNKNIEAFLRSGVKTATVTVQP